MSRQNLNDMLRELLAYNRDDKSTKNEEYARQLVNIHEEFVNRNKSLTNLLNVYIEQHNKRTKSNAFLKNFIFWFFISILAILTITISLVFIKIDYNNANLTSVTALISAAITYIGSVLSILKIMSKYLFPIEEEKDTISMIKTVINNDIEIEKIMSESIKDSFQKDNQKELELLIEYKKLLDVNGISKEEYEKLKKSVIKSISEYRMPPK